jgi:LacI family transcriptional regulator
VHQPVKILGQRAVEMLVARLTGANLAPEPVFLELEHAVVSRQTTTAI